MGPLARCMEEGPIHLQYQLSSTQQVIVLYEYTNRCTGTTSPSIKVDNRWVSAGMIEVGDDKVLELVYTGTASGVGTAVMFCPVGENPEKCGSTSPTPTMKTLKPGVAAGCPSFIKKPDGTSASIIDAINSYGSAEAALQKARDQERWVFEGADNVDNKGSCENFKNQKECEDNRMIWRDTVRALECHAHAESAVGAPPSPAASSPQSGTSSKTSPRDFLPFAEKAGTDKGAAAANTGSNGASAQSTKKSAGKGFLPFADDADDASAFPTPFCRFISDPKEQFDVNTQVCAFDIIFTCEDRKSADPKKAWRKASTLKSGCGQVRAVEEKERDRRQLKGVSKGMYIHE